MNTIELTTAASGGSGSTGGNEGLLIKESSMSLRVSSSDPLGAKTESNLAAIRTTNLEVITASETNKLAISGAGLNETKGAFSETSVPFFRHWASATTDNNASKTTPANANSQNNGVVATVKTALSLGDLTNPVVLTSTPFGTPTTGAYSSKKIRAYFNIPARTLGTDTLVLQYKIGAAAAVTFYNHAAITTLVDHMATGFVFDVSALTLTDLTNISLIASYTSVVVATPQSVINLDAWALELG